MTNKTVKRKFGRGGDQITSIHEMAHMAGIHFSEELSKAREEAMKQKAVAAALRLAAKDSENRQATSARQGVGSDSAIEMFFQELLPDSKFTGFLNRLAEKAIEKLRNPSNTQVFEQYVGMLSEEYTTLREYYHSTHTSDWTDSGGNDPDSDSSDDEDDDDNDDSSPGRKIAGRATSFPAISKMQGRVRKMMAQGQNILDPTESKFLCIHFMILFDYVIHLLRALTLSYLLALFILDNNSG